MIFGKFPLSPHHIISITSRIQMVPINFAASLVWDKKSNLYIILSLIFFLCYKFNINIKYIKCYIVVGCGSLIKDVQWEKIILITADVGPDLDLAIPVKFCFQKNLKAQTDLKLLYFNTKTDAFSICNRKKSVVLNLILVIYCEIPLL